MNDGNSKLSLAICGLGRFATRRILPAIAACQNVKLVAVVDCSGQFSGLPPCTQRFESLERFLATHPAGAVYVATPNYLHAQHSVQCLEAGLHVMCEKPMATSSRDCQSMVDMARKMNLHLKVGHMLRFSPALRLARSWLQDGLIGEPRAISTLFHYELSESLRTWAFRQEIAGGGALIDAGIHCIDAIRFLLGGPVIVLGAITDRLDRTDSVERSAACRFTVSGVRSFVQVCSEAPYLSRLSISGADGVIVIGNFASCWGTAKVSLYTNNADNMVCTVKEEIVDVSTIYSEQIRNFADSIGGSNVDCSESLDAAENVRIVEQLYEFSDCP